MSNCCQTHCAQPTADVMPQRVQANNIGVSQLMTPTSPLQSAPAQQCVQHYVQLNNTVDLQQADMQWPSSPATIDQWVTCALSTIINIFHLLFPVFFGFTLMPLFSTKSFHSLSLLIRSSSVSAITTRSSAYNNSHGATLNSVGLDGLGLLLECQVSHLYAAPLLLCEFLVGNIEFEMS